jgi:hypothetical protein
MHIYNSHSNVTRSCFWLHYSLPPSKKNVVKFRRIRPDGDVRPQRYCGSNSNPRGSLQKALPAHGLIGRLPHWPWKLFPTASSASLRTIHEDVSIWTNHSAGAYMYTWRVSYYFCTYEERLTNSKKCLFFHSISCQTFSTCNQFCSSRTERILWTLVSFIFFKRDAYNLKYIFMITIIIIHRFRSRLTWNYVTQDKACISENWPFTLNACNYVHWSHTTHVTFTTEKCTQQFPVCNRPRCLQVMMIGSRAGDVTSKLPGICSCLSSRPNKASMFVRLNYWSLN